GTWDAHNTFTVGSLTDASSNKDIVTGGSGDYSIAIVGPAAVNVIIDGNGSSKLIAGSGIDSTSISGGATLKIIGDPHGPSTIGGTKSTLELSNGDSGTITFAGDQGTLIIDGTTMPTGMISGFAPGDQIVLKDVPFDNISGATLFGKGNELTVVENG